MLYIQESLGPDEELVHVGSFHWTYTLNAFVSILWGVGVSLGVLIASVFMYKQLGYFPPDLGWVEAITYLHPILRLGSFMVFIFGLIGFAKIMITKATTEIAITSQRLVYKQGLVARRVGEISVDRIEGVNVLQSVLGRMLNYGRLAVRGMGIGEVILPPISNPLAFRQAIEKARTL